MIIIYCINVFIIIGIIFVNVIEYREWNKGNCRICGERWESFDTDSQGGRGYMCKNHHSCWISWFADKLIKPFR